MLKHNTKLRKLWEETPKIIKNGIERPDRRYKITKEFEKEFAQHIINST